MGKIKRDNHLKVTVSFYEAVSILQTSMHLAMQLLPQLI